MKRWEYFIEDMVTRERLDVRSMQDARAKARERSVETGHAVAVVAIDKEDANKLHPQGAYFRRTWRGGAHHYTHHYR